MSGIYINGMETPKSCNACMFDVYGLCLINKNLEVKDELTHSCPLIPVQDHGRLIDADVLSAKCDDPNWCVWLSDIDDAPTVIPADKDGAE